MALDFEKDLGISESPDTSGSGVGCSNVLSTAKENESITDNEYSPTNSVEVVKWDTTSMASELRKRIKELNELLDYAVEDLHLVVEIDHDPIKRICTILRPSGILVPQLEIKIMEEI